MWAVRSFAMLTNFTTHCHNHMKYANTIKSLCSETATPRHQTWDFQYRKKKKKVSRTHGCALMTIILLFADNY